MTNKERLNDQDVHSFLDAHPTWFLREGKLMRIWKFRHFRAAFSFVTQAALLFEKHNHHGDVMFGYSQVEISLTSHDIGGVSARDVHMAQALEKIT